MAGTHLPDAKVARDVRELHLELLSLLDQQLQLLVLAPQLVRELRGLHVQLQSTRARRFELRGVLELVPHDLLLARDGGVVLLRELAHHVADGVDLVELTVVAAPHVQPLALAPGLLVVLHDARPIINGG